MASDPKAASILICALFAILGMCLSPLTLAVEPDEVLSDPAMESRAREISQQLRCVVCQNQSIDDSNAELARDLRMLVRERLVQGESDQQVIDYIVSRYGDFILLSPPFKAATWVLWLGPAAIVLLGIMAAVAFFRRQNFERNDVTPIDAPLSADEQKRLRALTTE